VDAGRKRLNEVQSWPARNRIGSSTVGWKRKDSARRSRGQLIKAVIAHSPGGNERDGSQEADGGSERETALKSTVARRKMEAHVESLQRASYRRRRSWKELI